MTYTTIVAGVGDLTDNAHVIDRACEMARLNDAALLLVAGFDPVAPRDRARLTDAPPSIRPAEARLTEDEAYGVVEKARDIAVERGVDLAQGVVVEGEAVSALTLVAIETQADLVVGDDEALLARAHGRRGRGRHSVLEVLGVLGVLRHSGSSGPGRRRAGPPGGWRR